MRLNLRILFFLSFTLFASLSQAQIAGMQSYDGPACPQGSVSATTSPEGGEISILFDEFSAETSLQETWLWKWCSVYINVNVPEGYRIANVQSDSRAFADIPTKSYGYFLSQLIVLNNRWQTMMVTSKGSPLVAPYQDNMILTNKGKSRAVSHCPSRQEHIRVDTGIYLQSSPKAEQFATAVVDSVDLSLQGKTGSQVSLTLERCEQPQWPPRRPGHHLYQGHQANY